MMSAGAFGPLASLYTRFLIREHREAFYMNSQCGKVEVLTCFVPVVQ